MKIIDIGQCVDNVDPKGIGRIRYKPYGLFPSEIEKAFTYEKWDKNDPFIALPFLPPHINVIPQIKQSVKIIKYDTDKDTQNVEYITGPFSTPHDFGSESFTTQHKHTTYGGVIVKDLPDLKDKTGGYIDKKSNGTTTKLNDISINGNYGSDTIYTENGVVIRGGKLVSKETNIKNIRKRLQEVPILSEKVSKISLKKFSKTMRMVEERETQIRVSVSKIKYIVEYELNDLTSPTELKIFVYKVINPFGSIFDTNVFKESTDVDLTDITKFKLISEDDNNYTTIISIDSVSSACSELREFLYVTLDEKSLKEINNTYPAEDTHPFFFRPTKDFRLKKPSNTTEEYNKSFFVSNISIRGSEKGSSLVFSKGSVNPPIIETPKKVKKLKVESSKGEQTFASILSDYMYLLSSDVNKGENSLIDLKELDPYEYTQEDYLSRVHPSTYSVVRGETLIKLLYLMYEYMIGHVHNINKPGIYLEEKEKELSEMINNMKTLLINQSIRIN